MYNLFVRAEVFYIELTQRPLEPGQIVSHHSATLYPQENIVMTICYECWSKTICADNPLVSPVYVAGVFWFEIVYFKVKKTLR